MEKSKKYGLYCLELTKYLLIFFSIHLILINLFFNFWIRVHMRKIAKCPNVPLKIPYHLMPYQLQHLLQQYDEPVIFQLIPCLMLSYESWRAKKPQLLWPPLISISYCISLQTVLWSGCYAILCMSLSFRTGIKR